MVGRDAVEPSGLDHSLIPTIDRDLRSGRFRKNWSTHLCGQLADIAASYFSLENVVSFVFVDRQTITRGARREHVVGPDTGVEDSVRMECVHANAGAAPFQSRYS